MGQVQTELMVEICSKSLVRAIGTILLIENKTHKGDEKMAFVCKQNSCFGGQHQ